MSDNTVCNLSECAAVLAPYANTNNIVDDSAQAKANTTSQEECEDFDTNLCQPLDLFGSPGKPLMLPPMLQRSASSAVHAPPMLQRSASSVVQSNGPDCCGSDQFTGLEGGISNCDRSSCIMDVSDDDSDEDPLNIFKFGNPPSEQDDTPYGSA